MPSFLTLSAALLLIGASGADAALWGRSKIPSRFATGPVQLDGRGPAWTGADETEESGIGFRSVNDASNLYLLLTPEDGNGRSLLRGTFHQDVTVWFLGADGKSRAWGIRLPFAGADAPLDLRERGSGPEALAVEPQFVAVDGIRVSTAPLSPEIEVKADLSDRDPIYGLRIPTQRLTVKGKTVLIDLVSGEPPEDVKKELANRRAAYEQRAQTGGSSGGSSGGAQGGWSGGAAGGRGMRGGGSMRGGGRHGGGQGGGGAPRSHPLPEPPAPVALKLSIRLAAP